VSDRATDAGAVVIRGRDDGEVLGHVDVPGAAFDGESRDLDGVRGVRDVDRDETDARIDDPGDIADDACAPDRP